KLNIKDLDVSELLHELIKLYSQNPASRNIIFSSELNGKSIIRGDEDQLRQVFVNIFNNACDAMQDTEEKELKVYLLNNDSEVVIEFEDSGKGIPPENYSKVFTPFFTTKSIGKGTGLGLAISYGIIKMHRGSINFQSEVNTGTKFTVKLPKNPESVNSGNIKGVINNE